MLDMVIVVRGMKRKPMPIPRKTLGQKAVTNGTNGVRRA
jgi:hypothetical protein